MWTKWMKFCTSIIHNGTFFTWNAYCTALKVRYDLIKQFVVDTHVKSGWNFGFFINIIYSLLKSINFRVDPSRLIGLLTPSPFSSIAVTPFIFNNFVSFCFFYSNQVSNIFGFVGDLLSGRFFFMRPCRLSIYLCSIINQLLNLSMK